MNRKLFLVTLVICFLILLSYLLNKRFREILQFSLLNFILPSSTTDAFIETWSNTFFNTPLKIKKKNHGFYIYQKAGKNILVVTNYHYLKPESLIKGRKPEDIVIILDGEPTSLKHIDLLSTDLVISTKKEKLPPNGHRVYFPYYAYSFLEYKYDPYKLIKESSERMAKKDKFCFFAYSNCDEKFSGVKFRKDFLKKMQKMTGNRVDNLGNCYGGMSTGTYNKNESLTKRYKFVIAIENEPLPGYISEKLTTPMLSRCIPIYFGAPDVGEHFNTKSFIHIRDFPSIEDCINFVIKVDRNVDLYNSILSQPYLINNKFNVYLSEPRKYISTKLKNTPLTDIFLGTVEKQKDQEIYFLTFADGKRYKYDRIIRESENSEYFNRIYGYSLKDLSESFQNKHRGFIQNNQRGYGYWVWKPQVISEVLSKMKENDILFWSDSGNSIQPKAFKAINKYIASVNSNPKGILMFRIRYRAGDWTKMDTLVEILEGENLGIPIETILNSSHISSGLLVIRKNTFSVDFIKKWLKYAENYHLVDDSPSVRENDPKFKENRHDQTILHVLGEIYNIEKCDDNYSDESKEFLFPDKSNKPFVFSRIK